MDRTDPPLYAAADPPTVKTEPPGPAPDCPATDGAREPGPPASGTEGTGEPEQSVPAPEPGSGDDEAAVRSDAAPEQLEKHPQTAIAQTETAAGSDVEVQLSEVHPEPARAEPVLGSDLEQLETPAQPISGEAEVDAPAGPTPEPAPAHLVAVVEDVEPVAGRAMEAVVASAPQGASLVADQTSAPAHDYGRSLLADWDRERVKSVGVRAAKVAAIVFTAWFTVVIFLIAVYRFVNPPFSSLMVTQWSTGTSIHREWVPIERISPNLVRAVIASEDGRFCRHWGIDFGEIAAAIKRTSRGVPRGASTITMQVSKNLFLWPAKSYVRKVIEVPLTYAIEIMWPKRRIMEVYLNIAEWGPGVFGAEAAAREHFNRSATRLSSRQAAQLAVALPNPFQRDAGDPGPWTSRRASVIQRRAARSPEAAACVLGSK
jgi:monofunctional biosynthetic peptidoglycan transglycosylase